MLLVILFQGTVFSQDSDYDLALDYTKNYKDRGPDYKMAKVLIDKASEDPAQNKDAVFWLNKGKIYNSYYQKIEGYKDPAQVQTVLDCFRKVRELDNDKIREKDIIHDCSVTRKILINEGVAYFNIEELEKAYRSYLLGMQFADFINMKDSIGAFYAAAAADHMESYKNALKWYAKSESLGHRSLECCMSMMRIYKQMGDQKGYRNQIQKCQAKHPDNKTLLLLEVNRSFEEAKVQRGIDLLTNSLEAYNDDAEIHFALGIGYDLNGEPEISEVHYLKSIELRPAYFDALYNLGSHYFNIASGISREMEGVTDPDLYIKKKQEIDSWLEKARVYLEKANTIWDTEMATLSALEQIYARLNMFTQKKEVSAKIDMLEKQAQN